MLWPSWENVCAVGLWCKDCEAFMFLKIDFILGYLVTTQQHVKRYYRNKDYIEILFEALANHDTFSKAGNWWKAMIPYA